MSAIKGSIVPDTRTPLGGRLRLADRSTLTGTTLDLFDRLIAEALPWAQRAGFVMQSADGQLIGPFGPMLESPEISASFWDWSRVEGRRTTLSAREREIVILGVGAVWRSSYALYAHSAAARAVGLTPEQVETIALGGMPDHLSTRERCVWRFTHQLTAERHIEQRLHDETAETLGTHGIVDMLHLIGVYQFICSLLNTFDIPVPE